MGLGELGPVTLHAAVGDFHEGVGSFPAPQDLGVPNDGFLPVAGDDFADDHSRIPAADDFTLGAGVVDVGDELGGIGVHFQYLVFGWKFLMLEVVTAWRVWPREIRD